MARTHGRFGRLYVGATTSAAAAPVAGTKSWTLDSATDYADATAQGDTSKQSAAGLPGGSGSFEAFYDATVYTGAVFTAARDGLDRAIYFYPDSADTTKYWFGRAYVSGSVSSAVDGMTTVSGTFAASSDLIPVGIS